LESLLNVFLSEPPPTQFDLSFSFFGVPVRISPWFWLATFILGYSAADQGAQTLFIWTMAVFISILIHEMGHAIAMIYYGEYPRVVLYMMGGLAISEGGRRSSREQVIISLAGPGIELVLAALLILAVRLAGYGYPSVIPFWNDQWFDLTGRGLPWPPLENLNDFLHFMLWINVYWALVNLLPVYPLDGGQVARSLLFIWNPRDGIKQSMILSIVTGGIVAAYAISQHQTYMGMLFALLAFDSFQTYQRTYGRF
jgi:stage IV sporulation protein FB